jgi:hypothetical protein
VGFSSRSRPLFFYLSAIEGVVALIALLSIPSEGGSISLARFALLAIVIAFVLIWIYFGIRSPSGLDAFARPLNITSSALLSLTFSLLLFLLRYLNPERFLPLYERMSPLLWYLLVLSIQFTLFLLILKNGFHLDALKQNKSIYRAPFVAFALLLLLLLFVSLTKLGITKDSAYWGEPGVPILGWQFALAILLGAGMLIWQLLITNYPSSSNSLLLQILLPFSIYLTASALWLSVPIDSLRNSFYAPITPPYTTPFPYSDAGFYDYLSQSLLIGTDYLGGIPPRPLYVTFLAALHFLFGQDYVKIIAVQTLVLALFPVALYLLGTKLHSRAAGVTIALFAIFRELTTLWISSNTRTASTKMFITDFTTAMGIAFVCLVAVWWLERRDTKSTMIAGGVFGILLLLRTQALIILPVLLILAFFVYQKKIKTWLIACVTFGLVITATITPWLIHNYNVSGAFAFDDPSQMAIIFSQYSFNEGFDLSEFNIESESLASRMLTFTLKNPAFVSGFIANHFLNTEIGGLLALPLIERFDGLFAPVKLYWIEWNGHLEWYNLALILFYLAVIAIGIGASWARLKWIGLTPLAFNIGYALANGISRFSSWRYNLPVDWVAYFYFGIGIMEIFKWIASAFGTESTELPENRIFESKHDSLKPKHAFIVGAFVLVGALPWLAQGIVQPSYTATEQELKAHVLEQDQAITEFLSQPNSQILEGRLLYPRFFRRNDGIFSAHPWAIYAVRDFSRLGFIVLNQNANQIIFPADKPIALIHGADVIVVGCAREDHIEARWIFFPELDETYQAESSNDLCEP